MGDASVHHAHHQIGLAVQQGFHRRYAQLTGVHAVQAAGRSAALQVPQNGHLGVCFRKTSANGVRGFFDRFFQRFSDIRSIGGVRFACVGPATEKALRAYHLDADLVAAQPDAVALGRELMTKYNVENQKLVIATGNLAGNELPRLLMEEGLAIVDILKVYSTDQKSVAEAPEAAEFRRRGADVIVFASPSAVESFMHQAASLRPDVGARQPQVVAVGPTTAEAVRRAGIPLAGTAAAPTAKAIREAIIEALG